MARLSLSNVFKRPYVFYFVIIFFSYIILNLFLSGFYNTIPLIIIYAQTVNWIKLGFSIFLSLTTGFLVAVLSVLLFVRYKERKNCSKSGFFAGVGSVGGLAVGVCPLCVAGVFPLVLGVLGISFTFASLPFQGIEVQLLVTVFLLLGLFLLRK